VIDMSTWNCEKCGEPQKVLVTSSSELVHEAVSYEGKKVCQNCYNKIMREKQAEVEAIVEEEGKTLVEAVAIVKAQEKEALLEKETKITKI